MKIVYKLSQFFEKAVLCMSTVLDPDINPTHFNMIFFEFIEFFRKNDNLTVTCLYQLGNSSTSNEKSLTTFLYLF
jgi:hypothetical protein